MVELLTTYLFVSLFIYFLPFVISIFTGNRTGSVFLINLLLGWTFIGWVWAFIWAFTSEGKTEQIIINNNVSNDRTINPIISYPITENNHNLTNPQFIQKIQTQLGTSDIKSHQEKINQLQQLKQLLDASILTQEEFNNQKSKILES